MELENKYLEHVNIVKDLFTDNNGDLTKTTKEFEALYEKMLSADVNLANAKEFMAGLNKDELQAIKKYHSFADDIDVNKLTDEGAYNALVHHYEQYDFDNDGYTMLGEAKGMGLIPQNMDPETKKALVESYNDASSFEERSALTFMISTLDQNKINQIIAQKMQNMTPEELAQIEENSGIDVQQFILDHINYKPENISAEDVQHHIEQLLKHNNSSESTTLQSALENFSTRFDANYKESLELVKNKASTDEILQSIEEYKLAS